MKNLIFSFVFLMISLANYAQVGVNSSGDAPDASAGLDVDFNNKGLLPPRLTTAERDAINNPAHGLRIYNSDTGCENFYSGVTNYWMELCGVCPGPNAPTAGTHVPSENQVVWNWNVVGGETGYKWSTTNNYSTATVTAATTYTQTGLSASTSYTLYVWAYNLCGGSAVPVQLNSTTTAPPCTVGLIGPGGGYIFYCGDAYPGYSGLEAAPFDQSAGAQWGCSGTLLSGAGGTATGTGYQNTIDIVNGCGEADRAAKICSDLVLSGFDDWFLPSKDELGLIYTNLYLQNLGGFSYIWYWSSSQGDGTNAWEQYFDEGNGGNYGKFDVSRVRAVRRF